MKIAIMQPYFLPYIGYFCLIKHTEKFILFDPVQFIRHGWIERNRILKPDGDIQYIAVPLTKHDSDCLIKDIKIKNEEDWRNKILSQLVHYKKKAPYYDQTIEVLKKAFDIETDSIVKLNEHVLKTICDYLNINCDLEIFSEMNLVIETPNAPDEWALNICKALGNIKDYINPPGGVEIFDKKKYINSNINLRFLKSNLPYYSQRRGLENFEPGLSIVDVMMFNDPQKINQMLDDYIYIDS